MSIIVPAGNQKVDWSPKDNKKLTKKASIDGAEEVQAEEEDPVYEAAKDFLGGQEAEVPGVDEVIEEVSEVEEVEKSVSEAVAEVEQKAEEADQKIEAVVEAVEKIDEAVQGVKDAVADADDEVVEVIEIDEVSEDKDEDAVEAVPGEEVIDDEIIVETEGCVEAKTEDGTSMDKVASTEEEFCKYAKLSPQNKAKLARYWVDMLGYPKDYVNLMTKDYEK